MCMERIVGGGGTVVKSTQSGGKKYIIYTIQLLKVHHLIENKQIFKKYACIYKTRGTFFKYLFVF